MHRALSSSSWLQTQIRQGGVPQRAMTAGSDLAVKLLAMVAKVSNSCAEKHSSKARRSLPAFWYSSTALSSSRRCSKYSAVSSITSGVLCKKKSLMYIKGVTMQRSRHDHQGRYSTHCHIEQIPQQVQVQQQQQQRWTSLSTDVALP